VSRGTRLLWAVAIGAAIAFAAVALSQWVSPAAGWGVIVLALAVAYVRARRQMTR
jgi:uncharacterized membrane protein YgaE (UPF0421/DUF939 family)